MLPCGSFVCSESEDHEDDDKRVRKMTTKKARSRILKSAKKPLKLATKQHTDAHSKVDNGNIAVPKGLCVIEIG